MLLAAIEGLEKKNLHTYNGINVVTSLVPSFEEGSSSLLQVTRIHIKPWMTLNFIKIPSLNMEYSASENP